MPIVRTSVPVDATIDVNGLKCAVTVSSIEVVSRELTDARLAELAGGAEPTEADWWGLIDEAGRRYPALAFDLGGFRPPPPGSGDSARLAARFLSERQFECPPLSCPS